MATEAAGKGTGMPRQDPRLVSFRFSMAMAIDRISVPPPVVFVRAYDGETEDAALARSEPRQGEVHFVHLA